MHVEPGKEARWWRKNHSSRKKSGDKEVNYHVHGDEKVERALGEVEGKGGVFLSNRKRVWAP